MLTFGFPWPENLDCSRFPATSDLCVTGDVNVGTTPDIPNFTSRDLNSPLNIYTHRPGSIDSKSGVPPKTNNAGEIQSWQYFDSLTLVTHGL